MSTYWAMHTIMLMMMTALDFYFMCMAYWPLCVVAGMVCRK